MVENKNTDHCPVELTALILGKKWVPTIIFNLKDMKSFGCKFEENIKK